ncbi:phosphoglycerate mutase family protein [Flavobacteriaceae bacterium 3-367]|uniref:SixA phosphatase family protein n=1 Tax=Eudoraea algarum TaxID=3417568 RepID=UPI0032738EF1
MMKVAKPVVLFLLCTLFLACKEEQKLPAEPVDALTSTFYFIRHAEKDRSDPENIDPELTQDGLGRAMKWAEVLDHVALDAIYTTDYERTSMTAAPAAVKQDITVQYYDPRNVDLEAFKAANLGKNVLVVGHSNTTPDFVNKMIGEEKYDGMDDTDNSSMFIVQITGNSTTDIRLKIDWVKN